MMNKQTQKNQQAQKKINDALFIQRIMNNRQNVELEKWIIDLVKDIRIAYEQNYPDANISLPDTTLLKAMSTIFNDLVFEKEVIGATDEHIKMRIEASLEGHIKKPIKLQPTGSSEHYSFLCWYAFYLSATEKVLNFNSVDKMRFVKKTSENKPQRTAKSILLLLLTLRNFEKSPFLKGLDKSILCRCFVALTGHDYKNNYDFITGTTNWIPKNYNDAIKMTEELLEDLKSQKKAIR